MSKRDKKVCQERISWSRAWLRARQRARRPCKACLGYFLELCEEDCKASSDRGELHEERK